MYLEISNVATAINKNPYESRDKMLLCSWARHRPEEVYNYLIEEGCITKLKKDQESHSKLQEETYKAILPPLFDTKDFKIIEEEIVEDYKRKRNNEQDADEIKRLKELTRDQLKKDNGNLQEKVTIQKNNYKSGNTKMYYYDINSNCKIGGKFDALAEKQDLIIEIKTRTRLHNVRKNEYDLCQLICYMLATKKNQGKIVQVFNGVQYDSDTETEKEYGIVNLKEDKWKQFVEDIIFGLRKYFDDLEKIMLQNKMETLAMIIPNTIRPIAKLNERYQICDEKIEYKSILKFL